MVIHDVHVLHDGARVVIPHVAEFNRIEYRHVVVVPDHRYGGVELERSRAPTHQAILVEVDFDIRRGRQHDRGCIAARAERCHRPRRLTVHPQKGAIELFNPGQPRTPDHDTSRGVLTARLVPRLEVAQRRPAPRR